MRICCWEVVYLPVSLRHFFLCSQKVSKYTDKYVYEFQSSRRNILIKIHADIFGWKSSSVLKCFYCVSQLLLHDSSDLATTLTSWTLCLSTSYLELKLNTYTQRANACYSLLCILAVIKCKVSICWCRDKLLMQLKDKPQNLSDDGWELITVLPRAVKAWRSTVVSIYCLEVSLLIVLVKILWMKLFIYIHLSQEMNA